MAVDRRRHDGCIADSVLSRVIWCNRFNFCMHMLKQRASRESMPADGGAPLPSPSLSCGSDGRVVGANLTLNELQMAMRIHVTVPNGQRELLHRAPKSNMGMASTRFWNERVVLKVARPEFARREACALSLLRSTIVPQLLCYRESIVIMEHAGSPITPANLPIDYREQAEAILALLRRQRVQHNDIWKDAVGSPSIFALEILVDKAGSMRLVDFNTASFATSAVGGGACEAVVPALKFDPAWFTPSRDADVLQVLDAMFLANRTLRTYLTVAGARDARAGICRRDARGDAISVWTRGPSNEAGLPDSHEHEGASKTASRVAAHDAAELKRCKSTASHILQRGEFVGFRSNTPADAGVVTQLHGMHRHGEEAPGGANSNASELKQEHWPMPSLRLPTVWNPMPTLTDVEACVARCRRCSACRAVSVSTHRSACFWYSPNVLTTNDTAAAVSADPCETFGEATLRTGWNRPRAFGSAHAAIHSDAAAYQRLDDFVTVTVTVTV